MKAWRFHGWDDLRLDEVPEPAVRPGWVKVRIRVVQPSVTEVALLRGERTYGYELIERALARGPAQLFGHEFSAEIVELGAGVDTLRVGDRVAARGSHPDGIVGFDYPGALAEYGVFPASLFAVLPPHVDDTEGAAIQPLTDAVAAVHAAGLRLGDTVAVIGLGSMGLGCLQVARAAGAGRTIAIARREAALATARELGADDVVRAADEDPVDAVLRLTDGRGADVVFETAAGPATRGLAGGATVRQAGAMARTGGTVVAVAFTEGAMPVPLEVYRPRGLRLAFPSVLERRLFETTVALVATGRVRLRPLLGTVLEGLEQVPLAFAMTGDKQRHGLINPAQVRISR
ncbi:MAG: zinc-binding dehydrogenase [Steroidobacteraceae bacterium]|jgi:threonine dehydrogenase-like Zn-dependent dehydrogenase|nr:zinc-binding dehydrogenase [Steroidobacteraceae bacterium]